MVAGKRHAEVVDLGDDGGSHRAALDGYSAPATSATCGRSRSGSVLVAYCLWAFERQARAPRRRRALVPAVDRAVRASAILRYALLRRRRRGRGARGPRRWATAVLLGSPAVLWAVLVRRWACWPRDAPTPRAAAARRLGAHRADRRRRACTPAHRPRWPGPLAAPRRRAGLIARGPRPQLRRRGPERRRRRSSTSPAVGAHRSVDPDAGLVDRRRPAQPRRA